MQTQNYKTHRRFISLYHFILYPMIFACIAASVWIFYTAFYLTGHGRLIAITIGVLSISALLLCYYGRSFALKAQDRAIRSEENLRHFILTGKLLDNRLTTSQIIALRFANDTEFLILSERAATENLKGEEIKKTIVNWKGDHYRA
ncbi:MAG: DUF6526 family protein [Ginsengibacter sp.]